MMREATSARVMFGCLAPSMPTGGDPQHGPVLRHVHRALYVFEEDQLVKETVYLDFGEISRQLTGSG
jgi:hypothetical protein